MAAPRVFADANVLWSPQQRNLILQIAYDGHIEIFWSERIIEEWLRNVDDDQRGKSAKNTLPLLTQHFPEACLHLVADAAIGRTDPKDRHVTGSVLSIAPAILLTWNLSDFDAEALGTRSVEVMTPDDLLTRLFDAEPDLISAVASAAQANLTRSAPTWESYLEVLSRNRLTKFVDRLRRR